MQLLASIILLLATVHIALAGTAKIFVMRAPVSFHEAIVQNLLHFLAPGRQRAIRIVCNVSVRRRKRAWHASTALLSALQARARPRAAAALLGFAARKA